MSPYETGTKFDPASDVLVKTKDGKTLASTEYTLKYYRNGKETKDYESAGSVTMEFTINATKTKLTAAYRVASNLDKTAEIPATIADQQYTGAPVTPEINLVKRGTTIALTKDKDYTVSYTNNVEVGTATVIIEGIGEYYGTYVRTFKIVGEMEQEIVVLPEQERDLGNGTRSLNSKATYVKYTVAPKTAVTYTSSDEKVVTIDTKGNIKYTGLGEATITIKAAAEKGYKEAVKTVAVKVGLAKPTFTPSTSTKVKKGFVVTSSTVKGAEGWEVKYSLKPDLTSSVTKKFANTGAKLKRKTITANKSRKTYYVSVRSYAIVNGKTVYSPWSDKRSVVTK